MWNLLELSKHTRKCTSRNPLKGALWSSYFLSTSRAYGHCARIRWDLESYDCTVTTIEYNDLDLTFWCVRTRQRYPSLFLTTSRDPLAWCPQMRSSTPPALPSYSRRKRRALPLKHFRGIHAGRIEQQLINTVTRAKHQRVAPQQ